MTRFIPSLVLVAFVLSGCAEVSQTNRAYNDDLLNGIGALNGMPDSAMRGPLVGPGWQGVY